LVGIQTDFKEWNGVKCLSGFLIEGNRFSAGNAKISTLNRLFSGDDCGAAVVLYIFLTFSLEEFILNNLLNSIIYEKIFK